MIRNCEKHGLWTASSMDQHCPKCAVQVDSPTETVVIGGLDLAKFHDYSAFVGLEVRDGRARLKGTKQWPHVDYSVIVADTSKLYQDTGMRMLAVDATGVGEPIVELLYKNGVMVQDIKFGSYVEWTNPWGDRERAPVKHAMVEYARACFQKQVVKLPSRGADELIQQLKEQEIDIGKTNMQRSDARVHYAHPSGSHDDLAWAFLMALYVSRPWLTGNGLFAIRV